MNTRYNRNGSYIAWFSAWKCAIKVCRGVCYHNMLSVDPCQPLYLRWDDMRWPVSATEFLMQCYATTRVHDWICDTILCRDTCHRLYLGCECELTHVHAYSNNNCFPCSRIVSSEEFTCKPLSYCREWQFVAQAIFPFPTMEICRTSNIFISDNGNLSRMQNFYFREWQFLAQEEFTFPWMKIFRTSDLRESLTKITTVCWHVKNGW
jgi:hypothetical protein